jgi:hypothetical protein
MQNFRIELKLQLRFCAWNCDKREIRLHTMLASGPDAASGCSCNDRLPPPFFRYNGTRLLALLARAHYLVINACAGTLNIRVLRYVVHPLVFVPSAFYSITPDAPYYLSLHYPLNSDMVYSKYGRPPHVPPG